MSFRVCLSCGEPTETTTAYYVCFNCAHYHASESWPRRCENCGEDAMGDADSVERAEELSEAIMRERRL